MLRFSNPLDTDVAMPGWEIGSSTGDNLVYAGPKYGEVTQERYDELLQSGKIDWGQQAVELYGERFVQTAKDITPDKVKDFFGGGGSLLRDFANSKAGKVTGTIYDWTLKGTVDKTMNIIGAPVEIAHKASKLQYKDGRLDFGGRGIGKAPLGIAETILTAGGASTAKNVIKSSGKGVLNLTDDLLRSTKPAYAYATVNTGLLSDSANIAQKSGASNVFKESIVAKNVFASITNETKASQAYKDWDLGAEKWLEANRGKNNPMKGYPHFVDPKTGVRYRKGYETSKDALGNVNMDLRKIRDAKRNKKTLIPREEVARIMEKYNQPPEMVDMFMEYQKAGKKKIDATIEKINERILKAREKNPDAYPGVKASLGHGRAADRYEHSADMLSNIDLENFFINVKRSNLDEVSDPFNRALGRSLDLDEEILKFVDKDLGKLFGGYGLHRTQIDASIKYVRQNMNKKINWKSIVTDTGEQLFKSKEEYLINEALQKAHKLK